MRLASSEYRQPEKLTYNSSDLTIHISMQSIYTETYGKKWVDSR